MRYRDPNRIIAPATATLNHHPRENPLNQREYQALVAENALNNHGERIVVQMENLLSLLSFGVPDNESR